MSIRILATSDLHLGKKSAGVPQSAPESSSRHTWEKIVDWSLGHEIDILLLAGDIVDRENRFFEAIGPLFSGLERLGKEGITVMITAGNHDYDVLPSMIRGKDLKNIHILGEGGKWEVKTISRKGQSIQFIGWSFPNQHVQESPLFNFTGEGLDPNLTTIGIFHGDADSRDSRYGPFDLVTLLNKPIDAWIVGHIHKPQRLRSDDPEIWYPGSPQALSSKESGEHGPLLLTVHDTHRIEIEQIPLSPVRYETIGVDITGAKDEIAVSDKVTSELVRQAENIITELEKVRFLVFDIHLQGSHNALNALTAWTANIGEHQYEMETGTILLPRKVVNDAEPVIDNLEEMASRHTPAGIIAETILAIRAGKTTRFLEDLRKQWKKERDRLLTSGTYQPLMNARSVVSVTEDDVDVCILRECNRLLSEFVKQVANE